MKLANGIKRYFGDAVAGHMMELLAGSNRPRIMKVRTPNRLLQRSAGELRRICFETPPTESFSVWSSGEAKSGRQRRRIASAQI